MSDEFKSRLESAIARGRKRAEAHASYERQKEMSEEDLKRLHSSHRLALSDRIESAVRGVADHFPGFREESVFGEAGWGSACYRDDLRIDSGRRTNQYSRLELVVRPFSETVMNRELFSRNYFVPIPEADVEEFQQLIDTWAIEYAELYSAKQ